MIEEYFGAAPPDFEFRAEIFPGHPAPIIRLTHEVEKVTSRKECIAAAFGLIPIWSKDGKNYRHWYNALTETVFEKVSFRNASRKRQFCIVPMNAYCEPNYETHKPNRWRIERDNHHPSDH